MAFSFFKFFSSLSGADSKRRPPSQLTADIEEKIGLKNLNPLTYANTTMLSHLVWGVSLAYAEDQLTVRGKQMLRKD
ncbi:MAG: hypothetical protein H7061_12995 [Bdellovibrionaceae bacterium]|nr:hypothetical protein [Bdellovibrio sp.]